MDNFLLQNMGGEVKFIKTVLTVIIVVFISGSINAQDKYAQTKNWNWISGTWKATIGETQTAEVIYSDEKGGVILGMMRLTDANGDYLVVELFTLVEIDGNLEMRLRHFSPGLTAYEPGDAMRLVYDKTEGNTVTFKGGDDSTPEMTTTITIIDKNTYITRSEIKREAGDVNVIEGTYSRVK